MIEIRQAMTAEEREAVYRFRYSIYVEEMGRYSATADHANRWLVDPEDAHSWNFFAHDGREVVASHRCTWGPDGFSARQIDQYRLTSFLAELPASALLVGERTMVAAACRGTSVGSDLANGAPLPVDDFGIAFGACEPHLVSYYAQFETVPYADRNINSEESGYLIPLVAFPKGVDALRGPSGALPVCVANALDNTCAVTSSALLGMDAYLDRIGNALRVLQERPLTFFDGFTDAEAARCVARSNVIACRSGDRVVKQGGSASTVFVVLDGELEARDGDRCVGALRPGDVFGETAFLLREPRTLDVVAVEDNTRVLGLSERVLRVILETEPELAAKMMTNISRTLCRRTSPLATR